MIDDSKFPHFVPDKPAGVDCFEGHSQERLAHCLCDYIRMEDANPREKNERGDSMPSLIGLDVLYMASCSIIREASSSEHGPQLRVV